MKRIGVSALALALFLGMVTGLPANASALTIHLLKLGNGTATSSSSLLVDVEVSGGTSTNFSTCTSYFDSTSDVKISFSADGKQGSQSDPINAFSTSTLNISPTNLTCEFRVAPLNYFGYSWNFPSNAIPLQVTISSGTSILDQQTISMQNVASQQPILTITSPLRGSSVPGDFTVTTNIENSAQWKVSRTMAGAYLGAVPNCGYPVGNYEIKSLNSPNATTAMDGLSSSRKKVNIAQQSVTSFHYQFFQAGQYTICIWQTYNSVLDPTVSSTGTLSSWTIASVVVSVVAAVSNLTYSWDDPIFRMMYHNPYNFKFTCPNIKSSDATYTCSIQAQKNLSSSDLADMGISQSTSVKVTGRFSMYVCVINSDYGALWPCMGPDDVPDKFVSAFKINVGFDAPTLFKVKNYLNITGSTGVAIDGNGQQGDPASEYGWQMKNYQANKQKAANAPPSASVLSSFAKAIRKGMSAKCQKLPSGFSKFPIVYSKRITSNDGVPGYVFVVNKKLYLQVFDMGGLNIGPSPTVQDNRTFIAWGCGISALWVY